jgi:NADH-quinone oxidoreductase subunit J
MVELALVVGAWQFGDMALAARADPVAARPGLSNTQSLGVLIYTDYVLIFQVAGLILLTAMIGAIVLTHRARGGVRRQSPAEQAARTPEAAVALSRPAVGAGVDTGGGVR